MQNDGNKIKAIFLAKGFERIYYTGSIVQAFEGRNVYCNDQDRPKLNFDYQSGCIVNMYGAGFRYNFDDKGKVTGICDTPNLYDYVYICKKLMPTGNNIKILETELSFKGLDINDKFKIGESIVDIVNSWYDENYVYYLTDQKNISENLEQKEMIVADVEEQMKKRTDYRNRYIKFLEENAVFSEDGKVILNDYGFPVFKKEYIIQFLKDHEYTYDMIEKVYQTEEAEEKGTNKEENIFEHMIRIIRNK